jgi:DNA-binding response OmpR family regulator
MTVLLVEDSDADAELIADALDVAAPGGVRVHRARRLATAIADAATLRADAVLLDLSLPDSDGIESVRTAIAQLPSMPVLVLTGLGDEALAAAAIENGAQDYLVKGVATGDRLIEALRYAIGRNRNDQARRLEDATRSCGDVAAGDQA